MRLLAEKCLDISDNRCYIAGRVVKWFKMPYRVVIDYAQVITKIFKGVPLFFGCGLAMQKQNIHVLIFPTEDRQYAADCLELHVTTTEPTPTEAAKVITELINDHILTGLEFKISPRKIFNKVSQEELRQYNTISSFSYDYKHYLSPMVRDLIESIEYRHSDG